MCPFILFDLWIGVSSMVHLQLLRLGVIFMNPVHCVRAIIVSFLAFNCVLLAQAAAARADFTWTIVPDDPKIVDEGAPADITFTIKIMTTDESILVSKMSANFMFDSGPDQTDMPISSMVTKDSPTKAGDTLKAAGNYAFVVRVETSPWDGPNGDNGVFDAAKWRIFAPVTLLGLKSLKSSDDEGTAFLTIKDSPTNPVPEPSTFAMFGIGGLGIVGNALRRRAT